MEKFYENINAINGIKETYKMYCEILNENTKKILDFDNSLNDKKLILYTLNFNRFKEEIYNLLEDTIRKETRFVTSQLIMDYFLTMEHKLLHNECVRNGNIFTETIESMNRLQYNLKQVYGVNETQIAKLNEFLDYDPIKHKFTVNKEILQKECDKHIFHTENKKQEQIIKKIREFNKVCNELYELDICAYNYINPNKDLTQIEMNEILAKDIMNVR